MAISYSLSSIVPPVSIIEGDHRPVARKDRYRETRQCPGIPRFRFDQNSWVLAEESANRPLANWRAMLEESRLYVHLPNIGASGWLDDRIETSASRPRMLFARTELKSYSAGICPALLRSAWSNSFLA